MVDSSFCVTVLLTVYNGMPYLPTAVESILAQTYTDFIFLILDNGSQDGTGEYLATIADSRVQIVSLPENIGRTAVLNKGLSLVTTELTAILDADDVAERDRLQEQIAFLQEHLDVSVVGSSVIYIDSGGKKIGEDIFPSDHSSLCNNMVIYNQFAHSACCFRTAAVKSVGGYPKEFIYAQDLALWLTLLHARYFVASIAKPLAYIRVHPIQATLSDSLAAVRAEESCRLAQMLIPLPCLSKDAHYGAKLRLVILLWRAGQRKQSLALLLRLSTHPRVTFLNHYLYRWIWVQIQRKFSWKKHTTAEADASLSGKFSILSI